MLTILVLIITNTLRCDGSASEKYAIFPNLPPGAELSDNTICADHSRIYRENLDNFTLWAYEMWDSTAKSTVGVLKGFSYHMGHFDECLAVEAPFPTQYCLVTLHATVPEIKRNDPLSLYHNPNESILERLYYTGDKSQQPRNIAKIGWCTPASCKPEDLQVFLTDYVKNYSAPLITQNHINFTVSLSNVDCQSYEEQKRFNIADISFCILSLILILTVITATIFDRNQSKDSQSKKLLMSFSLKRNLAILMSVDEDEPALAVLHGIRLFATVGVIFTHRCGVFISGPVFNFDRIEALWLAENGFIGYQCEEMTPSSIFLHFWEFRKAIILSIVRFDLIIDVFLTMSGILVTYSLLNIAKGKTINPGSVILSRYIRLTPILGFLMFFYATLFNYSGTGPLWRQVITAESADCRTNWWINLLYLHNYINVHHMCAAHAWYLSCDFHYFLIAIGVCLIIRKNHKFGFFILFIFSSFSVIITFYLTLTFERGGLMLWYPQHFRLPKTKIDYNLIYIKSHTRAAPYFIGMLTGYIYHKLKNTNKHISELRSYIILILSVIIVVVSSSGGLVYYNPYHYYNKYESAFYAALNRPIFILGFVGILYVASYGHFKWIYNVLSWKPSIPLGKLCYGAYLFSMPFQLYTLATLENPPMFRYYQIFTWCIMDVLLSFIVALVLYLVIEAPLKQLCKELLSSKKVNNGDNQQREITL